MVPVPKVTVLPTRVSTSAKKGAMIGMAVEFNGTGVYSEKGCPKVRLPLLFRYSDP